MKRDGLIVSWHDRKIGAGSEWSAEIDASHGLRQRLTEKLGDRVIFEGDVLSFRGNYRRTPKENAEWRAEIQRVADRHDSSIELDFVVTVGSLATKVVIEFGHDALFTPRAGRRAWSAAA